MTIKMTDRNDVEWTKIEIPQRLTPVTPVTPDGEEETPPVAAEQAIKPEEAPKDPDPTGVTGVENDTRARLEASLRRLKGTWTPPDIVRLNRPSLQQVIAHAWEGEWGPKEGLWRTAGKIDAVLFSVPLVAFFYYCAWVVERPSRRICAIILLSVIAWAFSLWWWMS